MAIPNHYLVHQQLCWTCQNACGGCSWSARLEPVNGWTAIRKDVHNNNPDEDFESYRIRACPEYIPDDPK